MVVDPQSPMVGRAHTHILNKRGETQKNFYSVIPFMQNPRTKIFTKVSITSQIYTQEHLVALRSHQKLGASKWGVPPQPEQLCFYQFHKWQFYIRLQLKGQLFGF